MEGPSTIASDGLLDQLISPASVRVTDGGLRLIGGRCGACGQEMFPVTAVCPTCMNEQIEAVSMPDTGTLYSFTVVHAGPPQWPRPRTVGYVDLSNGVRVFSHLTGAVAIGDEVKLGLGVVAQPPGGAPLSSYVFARGAVP